MNCFEWQSRSSDYLDGTLIGAKKQEADAHLDTCRDCSEKHKHYLLLLTSIASQPRSALPISMRKAPFSSVLPHLDLDLNRSRWARAPWYIRTTFEATGIVLLTLAGVSAGPKIRALYEQKVEKSLSDFGQSFIDSSHSEGDDSKQNVVAANPIKAKTSPHTDEFSSEGDLDNSSSSDELSAVSENDLEVRVGNADIWRFILRTDSPGDLRPKIASILKALEKNANPIDSSTSEASSNIEGINAPGGIQFDLILPQSAIPKLKRQLFELTPSTPEALTSNPTGEAFTWYKIKSKSRFPEGKTRVVIWISQI